MTTQQWPDPDFDAKPCTECGMPCDPGEYHPFAACLMFKACHSSDTVRANLEAVRQASQARADGGVAREPLTERQIVACLVEAGCLGTVKMSYDSGPYEITRTSVNADKFARAIERAHGIASPAAELKKD